MGNNHPNSFKGYVEFSVKAKSINNIRCLYNNDFCLKSAQKLMMKGKYLAQ